MKVTMVTLPLIAVSLAMVAIVNCSNGMKEYRGYTVYKIIPKTEEQLQFLRQVQQDYSTYTSPFDVEFWKTSCCVRGEFHVMLNRKASEHLLREIESQGISPELLMPDVGG